MQLRNHRYDILDNLLEGCQVIGLDWRYLYVNAAAAAHGRRTRDELIGRAMTEVYPGIEEAAVFSTLWRCMHERETSSLENEFTYPDGSTAWFELRVEPVPEGLIVFSLDVTARKLAEQRIDHQLSRLRALREIDLAILGTTDVQLVLRTVLDQTTQRLQVDRAAVLLFDPHLARLELAASRGFLDRAVERVAVRLGEGALGRAALDRRMVMVGGAAGGDDAGDLPATFAEEGVATCCAVPLVAKGELMGLLLVAHGSALSDDPDWLGFLNALADQAAIAIYAGKSFAAIQRANLELALAYETTIEGWSRALDLRDKETEGHTLRVTEMTLELARKAGMSAEEIAHVKHGALLHDIGKMGVPDAILLKPAPLTDEEWALMRKHPEYAYQLLSPIAYLRPALAIPYCHHERWDGNGYPRGLAGEQIPLAARLFAVVDVWDALRSDRPYRPAWPEEKVLEHVRGLAGSHLDPRAVELFFEVREEAAVEAR